MSLRRLLEAEIDTMRDLEAAKPGGDWQQAASRLQLLLDEWAWGCVR